MGPDGFALDWKRPPRHMNTVSYIYEHADQWRYEKVTVDEQLSPLADKNRWKGLTLLDCNIKSQRMGWLPSSPEFNRNSLDLCREAAKAGMSEKDYVCRELHENKLALAAEDLDARENSPKRAFHLARQSYRLLGKGHGVLHEAPPRCAE